MKTARPRQRAGDTADEMAFSFARPLPDSDDLDPLIDRVGDAAATGEQET